MTHSLAGVDGRGGERGDRGGGLQRLVDQFVGRHDARDEAGALGFGGVHHAAGQHHLHRLGLADEAGQALRAAGAGDDAELDLRLAELRRVGGEDEVAHHRQFAAAAQREAGDRRDHRLARARDVLPARDEVAEEDVGEGLVLHLLDVGAGGEGLLRAGEHHGADRRIGLEALERLVEVVDQRAVQRVERLRPVETDEADAAVSLDENVGVGHRRAPLEVTAKH